MHARKVQWRLFPEEAMERAANTVLDLFIIHSVSSAIKQAHLLIGHIRSFG